MKGMMSRARNLLFTFLLAALLPAAAAFGESGTVAAPGAEDPPALEEAMDEEAGLPGETPPPADQPVAAEPAPPPVRESVSPERLASLLAADGKVHVYRVPITQAISKPNLFILRRAIKQAIERGVQVLVLDMDTPGGRLDVTLDMMELLSRFEGETITYVNKDAISAGAYISMATDSI
jgi:membrane-bound serine protease (ClpP class)